MPFESEIIPEGGDLNTYLNPGHYACRLTSQVSSLVNIPATLSQAFDLYVYPVVASTYRAQYIVEYNTGKTYYRFHSFNNNVWGAWELLYPTDAPTIPTPLPVDMGGTGAQTAAAALTSLGVPQEISNAFAARTATTVADNDLLPTNTLMIDYVNAHSLATPPSNFSFQVSPFPASNWEGEMIVYVEPVLSTTVGSTTYILARVYGSKKFSYTGTDTGTAFNIPLFSSLKPTEYPYIFSGGTNIATTLNIHGRSYTPGTYGFVPSGSASEVLIKDQVVSSVFSSGNLNMTHHLNCVFGDGTNTPGVTVSFNSLALMWRTEM